MRMKNVTITDTHPVQIGIARGQHFDTLEATERLVQTTVLAAENLLMHALSRQRLDEQHKLTLAAAHKAARITGMNHFQLDTRFR